MIDLPRPHTCKKELVFRKLKAIDNAAFNHDLFFSDLIVQQKNDLDQLLRQYSTMLKNNLDKNAPLQKKTVTVKDLVPWYNVAIREEKKERKRQQCVRRWRRTGLTIHREMYVYQRNLVNQLIPTIWTKCLKFVKI